MKRVSARVKTVHRQSDYPGTPDDATKKELKGLFEYVGEHYPEPEGLVISGQHAGLTILAHSPPLALRILQATHSLIAAQNAWGAQHSDLRELVIQVANLHFKCDICFQTHLSVAQGKGISLEQQAALPYWRTAAHMFSVEQRMVIEYAHAVIAGHVPEELFARIVEAYGEKGAVECTAVAALWAFWAMILNATGSQFDFGYGPSGA